MAGDHSISFKGIQGAGVMVDPIANQCTCHEIQKPVHQTQTQPIMMKMSDGSHIVLPLKKPKQQRMAIDSPYSDNKSPRRRRSYPMRNISTGNAFYHSDNAPLDMTSLSEPTLLMEMQSFLLSNSLLTTRDTDNNAQSAHSISSASSCSSSCSSPSIPSRYDIYRESSTSLSDVNNLISHVLEEEPVYPYEDMTTRSNTSTHPTPQSQWMCGSLIPHQSCPPLHLQTSGESIMLTVTPLMNFHSPDIIQPSLDKPASTRILTCYFGSNCICPECMVHPHQ
ncbi:hypothetical protein EDC96DRAFT_49190 [Choanephora cucurbitarum]|nr:hypothetical protein EDC96DRAFT_49190 [Choanephora cucurbitarum]